MWTFRSEELTSGRVEKFFADLDGKPATYADVLQGWQNDPLFRHKFNSILASSPFTAFKWETPCVTLDTFTQPFEFVLLNSPTLIRRPNPNAFAEHFVKSPGQDVLVFRNLGRDAIMIVPQLKTTESAYGHLAAFVREAPESQQHALWQAVGKAMLRRISARPVWLSTAGGGVSWLHVRLDDRPKYYGFDPYRQSI